ncbi:MAG: hypothetical protein SynsKO_39800 [Synoicihabitans sp.]
MKPSPIDYHRWDGERRGVGARSWVITQMGLRQLMRYKFFKFLLFFGWLGGFVIAGAGFMLSQTMAEGGWLADMAMRAGPRAEAVMQAFSALLLIYPDLLITGSFKAVFWLHSELGMLLSLAAMALLVPQLITRDRGSQALTIYLSRPITARDYLVGKAGIIVGVLLLLWTGPLVGGWLMAMALAPDSLFFNYSLRALAVALTFNAVALVVISAIAFGVSAIAKTAARARLAWIGLWIVMGAIAGHGTVLPAWIRNLSFVTDLHLIRDRIFAMKDTLLEAAGVVPILSTRLASNITEVADQIEVADMSGVVMTLTIMVIGAIVLVRGRIKPE